MSKKTEKRYDLKTNYFEFLKETAVLVDPYVNKFIRDNFKLFPELNNMLIDRYRFGKSQLRPALVRLSFDLAGGKDWKKMVLPVQH